MSIGDFPESLSQAMLVGITLVGRLGVSGTPCSSEVRHGVISGVSRERYEENGIGGEVRHGVTSGVSCETSKT